MNTSSVLNLTKLPANVRQQLIDYYQFLLEKYANVEQLKEKKTASNKEQFFAHVEQHRVTLPTDYKFDRDWANER